MKLSRKYRTNRAFWDRSADWYENLHSRALRGGRAKAWGVWRIPEKEVRLLEDVRGKDILELGCGAARWSIALAQDGARVTGLDVSPKRLMQARALMRDAGVDFPLIEASSDQVPCRSTSFDIVFSDYGATAFTDPFHTIPEASRLLRDGGLLVFAHPSPFMNLVHDRRSDRIGRQLRFDYFGMHEMRSRETYEYQLTYGEWVRLFSANRLSVEILLEPQAPQRGQSTYLTRSMQAWGRHWPLEVIWKLRKGSRKDRFPSRRPSSRPPPTIRRRPR